ncbi:GNAT family N-acetyltransferase [Streptomyces sp. RKND-216]|uniref:GNAT family N-acetyltransferase n=1 Tax=Streptomyces sp. RKND-216 TaxID=2562581 RepID=UPI00109DAC88|nr:GNAT family N-acetyltransferase [Streptomyces sp. RKND-216]THA25684.1 GNAT family N-acetyltransferase [Streptomyces sp. RKND-216]
MEYRIREAHAEDWRRLRELRLAALADPLAPVAFNERYEVAAGKPPSFWRGRAGQARNGRPITTLAAELPDGSWAGMLVVFVEDGEAHVVAVYLRPEHRGDGLAERLFDTAQAWAWARTDVVRMRLDVHQGNPRAEAFYRRYGFARTGASKPDPNDASALEWEMVLERPPPAAQGR